MQGQKTMHALRCIFLKFYVFLSGIKNPECAQNTSAPACTVWCGVLGGCARFILFVRARMIQQIQSQHFLLTRWPWLVGGQGKEEKRDQIYFRALLFAVRTCSY